MYDKDNKSFYEGNNGTKKWVSLKDISPYLIDATIYSEDKNFYSHNGFDIPRIFMSIFINLKNKDLAQGASTISQQYIKNLYLTLNSLRLGLFFCFALSNVFFIVILLCLCSLFLCCINNTTNSGKLQYRNNTQKMREKIVRFAY